MDWLSGFPSLWVIHSHFFSLFFLRAYSPFKSHLWEWFIHPDEFSDRCSTCVILQWVSYFYTLFMMSLVLQKCHILIKLKVSIFSFMVLLFGFCLGNAFLPWSYSLLIFNFGSFKVLFFTAWFWFLCMMRLGLNLYFSILVSTCSRAPYWRVCPSPWICNDISAV